jgi:site-specific recombinase XerD
VLYVHGKGRDEADEFVVINTRAAEALNAYLETRGPVSEDAPLFCGVDGRSRGRLSPRHVSRLVAGRLRAAGLKTATITAHSLRHTAATLAVQAGVSLSQVQGMMRHADPRTTARYVHLHDRLTRAAEHALDF